VTSAVFFPFFSFVHLAIAITGLPREGVDLVEWNIPRRARGSVGVNPERRFQMCAVRRRGCFFSGACLDSKNFKQYSSHRILRHIVLDVEEKKN